MNLAYTLLVLLSLESALTFQTSLVIVLLWISWSDKNDSRWSKMVINSPFSVVGGGNFGA